MVFELANRYRHKIKTPEELAHILGPMPREKKVIMCHGVFDVVHPGHVRHLLFAKSKAEILIASLTADEHIEKGKYRPHIPQDLRAINLAAFELVDFVVIDSNATPIENLKIIKPDFFAKGYEYTANSVNPKTAEEIEVIQSFGGDVIFTPGDIVYSSTSLINLAPPSIKIEKLLMLMERENLSFDLLRDTLNSFGTKNVHVIGDTIVDSYTHCAMIGGQTKTPTMSVHFEKRLDYIGGAAVVAQHLKAAGANVTFTTMLGADKFGEFVLDGLNKAGIHCNSVIDAKRPTVNKNAIVAGGYRLLKVDTLDNSSISDGILNQMIHSIQNTKTEAIVYSDFRHGIFNRRTIPHFLKCIPSGVFKVGDSQVASRWGNITEFKGFDLITPNEREARFALGDQDSGIRPLASALFDASQCKILILKMGDRGVLTCRGPDHQSLDSFIVMDSFVDHLVDAVGAGDALLAYSTLAMLTNGNSTIATILGNLAAAVECEFDGNHPVTPELVLKKLDKIEYQASNGEAE